MYAAAVKEEKLTFEVECVWRRNMIIRDRETGSLWQHATGEAVAGPLKGESLTLLGGELVKWSQWKQMHKKTMAALEPDVWTGIVPRDKITIVLEKATGSRTVPGLTRTDPRLPGHEPVVGILFGDTARAYPLTELMKLGVIEEMVNGEIIRVQYSAGGDQVSASHGETVLHVQRTWWAGWYEFYPHTTVFRS